VQVDPDDYVGEPQSDAEARLQDAGLDPVSESRANPGGEEAGTVAAVRPTGEVEQGSPVTLEVWDEPSKAPPGEDPGTSGKGDKGDKGTKGNSGKGKGNSGDGGGPLDDVPGAGEG
jgi:beta-lactam-binding protein with PASTA domain